MDSFSGYTVKTGGLSLGMDKMFENEWVFGGAFTYARTKVFMNDIRTGDDDTINTYQLTGYTSRDFGKWYFEGMAAYARQTYDTNRYTGVSGVANGDFNGNQYALRATVGMPFELKNNYKLTPKAGLEWNYLNEQGYTETGGGPLALSVHGNSATRVRSSFGAELSTEKRAGEYSLRPAVSLQWRHDFINDGLDTTASFTGGGTAFTTGGQNIKRNTTDLGLSLSVSKTKDFAFITQLNTEQASHYSGYSGQIQAQWKF